MSRSGAPAWFVDLSLPIQENSGELIPVQFTRLAHTEGAKSFIGKMRGAGKLPAEGGLSPEDFPDAQFLSNEMVSLSVHTATHLDAPYHFGPTSEGKPAAMIDEIPLDWCFGPGVVLDLTKRGPGESISADDIATACSQIEYEVVANDIILIRTGSDRSFGTDRYPTDHPGMAEEATAYLVERGVRVIGIDAAGFDRPTTAMLNSFMSTHEHGHLWPSHFYGRKRAYCHIERLCNLDQLPPKGFTVSCFPIKVAKAGAAWTRVVAMGTESARA